jgi:hypothetical protein
VAIDPVKESCFAKAANGIDSASYAMYKESITTTETLKTALMPQVSTFHSKIGELMSSLYITDIINAPFRALSAIDSVTQSVFDIAGQVLSSMKAVTATFLNANQSIALSLQQVEAMRLTQTVSKINETYNKIREYQHTLDIISNTFSGEDGFPDPLSYAYGELKSIYEDVKYHFDNAYDILTGKKEGASIEYTRGINKVHAIITGEFSDQGPEFIAKINQALDVIQQIRIQCSKLVNYRAVMLEQMDAISQGIRRLRDEVTFDFGMDLSIEQIQKLVANSLERMENIPEQCKNNPEKYSAIFAEGIAQSVNINELASASMATPIFDKQRVLNFDNPEALLEDDEIDDCYAHAMQLYAAAKTDLDNIFGEPLEADACYGSSTSKHPSVTTDVSFDKFDAELAVLCAKSNQIADLGLASLFGISGTEVSESGTSNIGIDISSKVVEWDNDEDELRKKTDKLKRAIEDFSLFPFADPNILSAIERIVTAGGQWMRGLDQLSAATLWDLDPDSFLNKTPIGYVYLTLRNCLTSLVNTQAEAKNRQGFDSLIRSIKNIEAQSRKYINDFTRMIEALMGFFSTIVSIIDRSIAAFIDMMLALLTVCDFPGAESWAKGLEDTTLVYRDGISRLVSNQASRNAYPPVFKSQPTIRTVDAPLAVKAVGLCKDLSND